MQSQSASVSFSRWKPIEIMLAVLFLSAPFVYFPNIGGTGLRIPFNITVWLIANLIAWYSLFLYAKRAQLYVPKYFVCIAAFPILATTSGFVVGVVNPTEWLFRLLFIWYGLLFFLGLFQHNLSSGRVDRLLFIIVISALLQASVGVLQVTISDFLPAWFPRITGETALLPYGFFQQINNQATYQVTAFFIAVFLITRPYIVKGQAWKRILILIFFALTAFIISYSGSRIGVLSFLIALPLAVVGRWQYLKKNKMAVVASLIFVLVGVSMGTMMGAGLGKITDKTSQITQGYTGSARLGIYAVASDLVKEEPLFGYGIGNFRYKWQYHKPDFQQSHPHAELTDLYITHPHNEVLFWMIEGGLVAVAGLFILVIGITLSLKGHNQHRWGIYLAFLIPIMLHTQVELPFYTSALHWFLGLTLLFLIMRTNKRIKKTALSNTAKLSIKTVSVFMMLLGTIFLTHSMAANYELSKKGNNLWKLRVADVNPYFSEIVESLQMKNMFLFYHKQERTDEIHSYIDWAEEYLTREPSGQMFVLLAMAYQDVNKKDEMCRVIKLGNSIYPSNESISSGLNYCRE